MSKPSWRIKFRASLYLSKEAWGSPAKSSAEQLKSRDARERESKLNAANKPQALDSAGG